MALPAGRRDSRTIPLFVVAAGNFTGNFEKTQGVAIVLRMLVVRVAVISTRLMAPVRASAPIWAWLLHDDELVGGQSPRFEQDGIRNADLADVVQRRCLAISSWVSGSSLANSGWAFRPRISTVM